MQRQNVRKTNRVSKKCTEIITLHVTTRQNSFKNVQTYITFFQNKPNFRELYIMAKIDLLVLIKWNGYILLFDCITLLFAVLVFTRGIPEIFTLLPPLLLIEAALVFFLGSSFEFSSSIFFSKIRQYVFRSNENWSIEDYDTSKRKAIPYFLLGLVLFTESIVLSFVFI